MLTKIFNFLFPKIVKAKRHKDDGLMFIYYSNGKRKIFQGSGLSWIRLEDSKLCGSKMIDFLSRIEIKMNKIKTDYVDL